MTPKQAYLDAIQNFGFRSDTAQYEVVRLTQQLYLQLIEQSAASSKQKNSTSRVSWYRLKTSLKQKFFSCQLRPPVKGLYLWGGVGGGKTWLIDSFFNALPFADKKRIHFHDFMQEVHTQLKNLPKTPDPLNIIALQTARQYRLLCIDEFHVQDITDAMLLAGLLEALFSYNVTLVTTSNLAPDELYKNGLQRDRFLPAIEWIKQNTQVVQLKNITDYRYQTHLTDSCYHTPLNQQSTNSVLQHFINLSSNAPVYPQHIVINKRPIQVVALNHSSNRHPQTVVWFEFNELCNTARSNSDYLQIAQQYPLILITNVYQMDEQKDDVAKRFIHLIDALYDKHCNLIISAETDSDNLYRGRRLKRPFLRTASRLKEMRCKLYRGKIPEQG